MKTCTKCGVPQEIEQFGKSSKTKDRLRCWCKTCQRQDNKARESSYSEYRKRYRIENKEEYRAKKRAYFEKNRDKILANNSEWRKTFNGRLLSYKRGAIKRGIEWKLTNEEFQNFWNSSCSYCGEPIIGIGIDRINSNLGYTIDNTVTCCYQCNIAKMDYTEQEFLNKIKQIYELQRSRGRYN